MLIKRRKVTDEEGAVAVLVALILVVLLGITAFAIDFGMVYLKKEQLQTAVDAAARAGSIIVAADELTVEQKETQYKQRVVYYLKQNGFPQNILAGCNIQADIENSKEVSISATYDVKMSFAKIFGKDFVRIGASSTAVTDATITEGKKVTVDVVFVLDISGSMYWDGNNKREYDTTKLIPMINAVNISIDEILKQNANNRVSVVVYSSSGSVHTIMKPSSNPAKVTSAVISGRRYNFQRPTAEVPNVYIGYYIDKIYNNRGNMTDIRIAIGAADKSLYQDDGGTFTQKGIYQGAKELYNSTDDGETRLPAVFVMSDGEATYASTNYCGNIGNNDIGTGSPSNMNADQLSNIGYYTVLTANYWKGKLSEEYTRRNGQTTEAHFYSLGYSLNTTRYRDFAQGVLNPKALDTDATSEPAIQLRNKLRGVENPYKNDYGYADTYYAAVDAQQLKEVLKDFANDVIEPTKSFNTRLTK